MPNLRSDCHSPANFDPALYEYVGSFDSWRDYNLSNAESAEENVLLDLLRTAGFPGGNWETRSTCDHCGARIRYVAVFLHGNGEHIATGETCAENAFGHLDRLSYDVDRLRSRAAAAREAAKLAEAAAEFLNGLEDAELHEALTKDSDLSVSPGLDAYALSTIEDIRRKLYQWGNISDRQAAFVKRLIAQGRERLVRQAEQAEEIKVPAPLGRQTFEGVVVSRKGKDTDYGYVYKLTVKVTTPEGIWLAWFSEPNRITVDRGDIIKATVTLSPSDNAHFAFGKRPTGVEVLGHRDVTEGESALD